MYSWSLRGQYCGLTYFIFLIIKRKGGFHPGSPTVCWSLFILFIYFILLRPLLIKGSINIYKLTHMPIPGVKLRGPSKGQSPNHCTVVPIRQFVWEFMLSWIGKTEKKLRLQHKIFSYFKAEDAFDANKRTKICT